MSHVAPELALEREQEELAKTQEYPAEEETVQKEKKPRKKPVQPEPVLTGEKDAKGRDILQGPHEGKYILVTTKNGKERKYYVTKVKEGEASPKKRAPKRKASKKDVTEEKTEEMELESKPAEPSVAAKELEEKLDTVEAKRPRKRRRVLEQHDGAGDSN